MRYRTGRDDRQVVKCLLVIDVPLASVVQRHPILYTLEREAAKMKRKQAERDVKSHETSESLNHSQKKENESDRDAEAHLQRLNQEVCSCFV